MEAPDFKAMRFNPHKHLGGGDVRLTIAEQDEIDALLAAKDAEIERLRERLESSTNWMQRLLDETVDCGDPDAECPLQDAHKDYHIAGCVKKNRAALNGGDTDTKKED